MHKLVLPSAAVWVLMEIKRVAHRHSLSALDVLPRILSEGSLSTAFRPKYSKLFLFFFSCLPEIEELTSRLLELVLQLVILYQYFQSRNMFLQLEFGTVFYFREVSKSLNVPSTLLFGSFSSMTLNLNMLGCLFPFLKKKKFL